MTSEKTVPEFIKTRKFAFSLKREFIKEPLLPSGDSAQCVQVELRPRSKNDESKPLSLQIGEGVKVLEKDKPPCLFLITDIHFFPASTSPYALEGVKLLEEGKFEKKLTQLLPSKLIGIDEDISPWFEEVNKWLRDNGGEGMQPSIEWLKKTPEERIKYLKEYAENQLNQWKEEETKQRKHEISEDEWKKIRHNYISFLENLEIPKEGFTPIRREPRKRVKAEERGNSSDMNPNSDRKRGSPKKGFKITFSGIFYA